MPRKPTRHDWHDMMAINAPEGLDTSKLPKFMTQEPYKQPAKRGRPEEALQILVCDYLRKAKPQLLFFAVPNHLFKGNSHDPEQEGKFSSYMSRQRKMGLTPGVSDLVVIGRNRHGATVIAFAELKAPTGRISPSQAAFQDRANGLGCYTAIVRTLEDLQALLSTAGL